MSSIRQLVANRRNALLSTGPTTIEGKQRSRKNAVRHGLMAETVIGELEDPEDYRAFETAVMADYHPETAVERELVLRLANILWRLRRAAGIETGLFSHASRIVKSKQTRDCQVSDAAITSLTDPNRELTETFLQLLQIKSLPLDRLSRYEQTLWRQSRQIIMVMRLRKSSRKNRPERATAFLVPSRHNNMPDDAI